MKDGGYTIGKFFNFRPLVVSLWFIVFLFIGYALASADTFNVNTTDDTVDADTSDGVCLDSNSNCSLRAAIMQANALPGSHTIVLQSGATYTLMLDTAAGDENNAAEDDLDITATITIQGNGATIERNDTYTCIPGTEICYLANCSLNQSNQPGEFRVFEVRPGGSLTLENATVQKGCADNNDFPGGGGGILNNKGTLTIDGVTISKNRAYRYGGGVQSYQYQSNGLTTITNSEISLNQVNFNTGSGGGISFLYATGAITRSRILNNQAWLGGGIKVFEGVVDITDSEISGNEARNGSGGGMEVSGGTVTITRSTISGNKASNYGGAIYNSFGMMTLTNTTISGNTGSGAVINAGKTLNANFVTITGNSTGGIYNDIAYGSTSTINVKNSIIGDNTSYNCYIPSGTLFNAYGSNFSTDNTCTGFTQVTSAQLNLQPLDYNGGPTQTHALGAGSVAIDAVSDCTDLDGNSVTTDQRGEPRPQGSACDAGAFEGLVSVGFNTLTVTKAGSGSGTVTSDPEGIDCGSTCSADFEEGAEVILTAIPDSGSVFAGWSGDCEGMDETTSIVMDGDKECVATFNAMANLPDLTAEWLDFNIRSSRSVSIIRGVLRVSNEGVVGVPFSSRVSVNFCVSDDGVSCTRLIGRRVTRGPIAPGGYRDIRVVLVSRVPVSGKYIIAVVDPQDQIEEVNEMNNIVVYGPLP
jgi:CSLREA domain-containing protein